MVVRGVEVVVPAVESFPTDDFLEAEDFLGLGVFGFAQFSLLADFADVESGSNLFFLFLLSISFVPISQWMMSCLLSSLSSCV